LNYNTLQLPDSVNNLLKLEIHISLKMLCYFYQRRSDRSNLKVNIAKFILEPLHIILVESEVLAFWIRRLPRAWAARGAAMESHSLSLWQHRMGSIKCVLVSKTFAWMFNLKSDCRWGWEKKWRNLLTRIWIVGEISDSLISEEGSSVWEIKNGMSSSRRCARHQWSCTHFISRKNSNRREIGFISRILSLEVSTIKRIRVSDLPELPEIGGLCMPAQPASDQVKRGQDKEELGQKNA